MTRRHVFLLLRILCGVLLLWWAWRQVDSPLREVMATADLDWRWVTLGFVLGGVAVLGWAVRWQFFLRMCGLELPMKETVRLTLFADFFNLYFLGPLGADGMRMLMLTRRFPEKKGRILMSIILDHASGFLGGAILYALFTRTQTEWLFSQNHLVPAGAVLAADLLLVGAGLATVAAAVLIADARCWRFIRRSCIGWTLKVLEPFLFLQGQRLRMTLAQLVSLPILVCTYATYWAAGMATHQSPSLQQMLAVMPLVDVVCGLPITISGLGVRESVFVGLLGPHFPQGNQGALLTSLLGFALTGVWGLIGGVWLALYRRQTRDEEKVVAERATDPV